MNDYLTIDQPNVTVRLVQDDDAFNPRTDCDGHLAVIACRDDHRHYTFGDPDAQFDIEAVVSDAVDAVEEAFEEGIFVLADPRVVGIWPTVKSYLIEQRGVIASSMVGLSVTDHSGLYMEVGVGDGGTGVGGQLYMGFDSAFVGWAYATSETQRECGTPDEKLRECVAGEAREYGSYLAGDCWGYIVEDAATGETLDSCWGYLGYDYAKEVAIEAAKAEGEALAAAMADLTYKAQVDLASALLLAAREQEIADND